MSNSTQHRVETHFLIKFSISTFISNNIAHCLLVKFSKFLLWVLSSPAFLDFFAKKPSRSRICSRTKAASSGDANRPKKRGPVAGREQDSDFSVDEMWCV